MTLHTHGPCVCAITIQYDEGRTDVNRFIRVFCLFETLLQYSTLLTICLVTKHLIIILMMILILIKQLHQVMSNKDSNTKHAA